MNTNPLRRQPLYAQIKSRLLLRIGAGEWSSTEPLPSEWELASEMAVSQGTVRKALNDLVAAGVLFRQQGRGTFVADPVDDWGRAALVFPGDFEGKPEPLAQELLSCSRVHAGEDVARALQIRRGAPLFRVRLLWRQRSQVAALDDAYLPEEAFEGMDARWIRQSGGVYATLQRRFGVRVRIGSEQMQAASLPREEAGMLGAMAEQPVLVVLRLTHSMDGMPVEWRQRFCLTGKSAYSCGALCAAV